MTKYRYTTLFFLLLLLTIGAGVFINGYPTWWLFLCLLGYVSILVLGSIYIQWNFYLKSVNALSFSDPLSTGRTTEEVKGGKSIAITFDDGPAAYTASILDILQKERVAATFFIIGKNIEGNEALLERMHDEGHVMGNHSFYHGFNFDWQSVSKMQAEIERANLSITSVTGIRVHLFRPPYGVTNPNLAKAVHRTGMKSIGWNLRSMDTIAKDKNALLQKILKKVKPGSILLLHDHCAVTADILSPLIKELKKRGFVFNTIN